MYDMGTKLGYQQFLLHKIFSNIRCSTMNLSFGGITLAGIKKT